ncbi:MAG: FadR family transcriptional regulator, partial [Bacteroidetes bacterium]|nr:FadR family transcriptional regulator [Bacteroidota bacterium]
MDVPFKPAKGIKLFQDIVEQIQDAIFTNRLIAGQKLPSERKLEKMFQASRPTIREAIRVIEDRGLIHTRIGKKGGIIVNSKTNNLLFDNFYLLIRSQNFSINDLAEFREKIEGEVVQTAAEKFNDLDIHQLKKVLEDVKKYSSRK